MASVFDEVTITWKGREVTARPTMRFINRLEASKVVDIDFFAIAQGIREGRFPKASVIVTILRALLESGGETVTDDDEAEIYSEVIRGQMIDVFVSGLNACYPVVEGLPKGDDGKAKKKTAKAAATQ